MNQNPPLNFTTVLFSGFSYYVSICPDFVDTESLGVPFGISIFFRNFQKQEDAELLSTELNSILRSGFENLKNNNVKIGTIDFCSIFNYQYSKNELFLCLNDNIFNLNNEIYLKEKLFLSLSFSETEVKKRLSFCNQVFNGFYKEFIEHE